ncbi:adenylosuccinate synthase [Candidatus Formimonas warabiya]|uniref:Adenylosuccinate synthetase n=1 Tax=Formimonas warabiya TaxID=1761012 RepID=A0A3G1KZG3_FORW1|nr:adenylosuccinate synthase [Candidatus Formimonas warabiya]ATW27774.1 adenylosuccinate synthase [Candidatus Formimonas warabiya]
MSAVVLIGAQWGDEGKGKITDYLAGQADVVARYQGGNNAGHTVVAEGREYKLHLIPSGILYPQTACVIGNGVVVDPEVLLHELDTLKEQGINCENLHISDAAHVIMPYHRRLDALEEEERGGNKLGTTCLGIGPAYSDKTARIGIRMGDLFDRAGFMDKLHRNLEQKNRLLKTGYYRESFTVEEIWEPFQAYACRLKKYVKDTSLFVNRALDAGQHVLFEGAQGSLLDLDHGTYPYVTSSYPTAGGACLGMGVGPTRINHVIGVTKAYTTRVGEGPFPTELFGAVGRQIHERGREFGTTTGRPRRCGWLDLVVLRYTARVNGLTSLAMTKLDVLDHLSSIYICTGYVYQGQVLEEFPHQLEVLGACRPQYEELPGWQEDTSGAATLSQLPGNARHYLDRVEELTGVPISLVAIGPGRHQTIPLKPVF